MTPIAKLISNLFSPIVVAAGTFAILIGQAGASGEQRLLTWLIAFVCASCVPLVTLLILRRRGAITDLDVSHREQRFTPLLISIGSYGLGYCLFELLHADNITKGLLFCYLTNIVIVTIITRYWKISIHAAGLTGPLAALWLVWNAYAWPMAALTALVGTSRVVLKAHTPTQVLAGSVLGFVLTIVQLKLFFI